MDTAAAQSDEQESLTQWSNLSHVFDRPTQSPSHHLSKPATNHSSKSAIAVSHYCNQTTTTSTTQATASVAPESVSDSNWLQSDIPHPDCALTLSRVGTASSRFLIFSFLRARTHDLCTTCLIWMHHYLLYD
ncbi:hypothetical protein IEO21_10551 [Rhodonia placenta]|uniref:Uncharacterized protein n=1 Tax=Rhodonia placenta TaxID=104341 RepID=A0A8H7TXB7_9APHY|nr:hypothetical protein IEO21_10551 [Postia placenta]